jgi:hypothetical protein
MVQNSTGTNGPTSTDSSLQDTLDGSLGQEALDKASNELRQRVLNSPAIKRLIEEVDAGDTAPTGYNRTYSRHNR